MPDASPWYLSPIEGMAEHGYIQVPPERSGMFRSDVALARNRFGRPAGAARRAGSARDAVAPAVQRALPVVVVTPPTRLRRCVYRRLEPMTSRGAVSGYAAACVYEGLTARSRWVTSTQPGAPARPAPASACGAPTRTEGSTPPGTRRRPRHTPGSSRVRRRPPNGRPILRRIEGSRRLPGPIRERRDDGRPPRAGRCAGERER